MQKEPSFDFTFFEVVDELFVFLGSERGRNKRLRLAAGEQRSRVRAVTSSLPT